LGGMRVIDILVPFFENSSCNWISFSMLVEKKDQVGSSHLQHLSFQDLLDKWSSLGSGVSLLGGV